MCVAETFDLGLRKACVIESHWNCEKITLFELTFLILFKIQMFSHADFYTQTASTQ